MPLAIALAVGYLVGSILLGIPISRIFGGVDIRTLGSGNPGFTNVLRSVGRRAGVLTLVADLGKGALAVLLARQLAGLFDADAITLGTAACVGAVIGHALPIFHRFKGGKGVATATGGFLTLIPGPTLVSVGVWIVVLLSTRYMSVASIAGSLTLPVYLTWVQRPSSATGVLLSVAWSVAVAIVLLHRSNLARLARGEERKFSLKRS